MAGSVERGSLGADVGLALAGGGPAGAIYEIGALRALDEALEGLDLNDLDIYVGVSAGAFVCASLANRLSPSQMCRAIVKPEPGEHPFVPETFLTPAFRELGRRTGRIPGLLFEAFKDLVTGDDETSIKEALPRLARALPVGLFDNERIRRYLAGIYGIKGRSDDFRTLGRHLVVVAADLDSGEAVRFGEPGFDHVPISKAVQASTALPGLYSPVEIDGRYYVDGVLLKTLHASVALEAGAKLLLCINPIVPVDTVRAVEQGIMKRGRLIDRGLPTVLSQTFRTLIHSRLGVGLSRYRERFEDADVVLLEPKRDDYRMFFRNIFSFRGRKELCEHAYDATRAELRARADELEPLLARHGVGLRRDVLEDEGRRLWPGVGLSEKDLAPKVGFGLPRLLPKLGRDSTPRQPRPGLEVTAGLDRALDRLDHLLDRSA